MDVNVDLVVRPDGVDDGPGSTDRQPEGAESGDAGLSEDRIFTLLSAGRRREVLRHLQESDGELPLPTLTRRVAEGEGIGADADPADLKKVYVSLYQTHVPALAAAEVIEYDVAEKVVRLTPRADPLFAYLEVARPTAGDDGGFLSRFRRKRRPTN